MILSKIGKYNNRSFDFLTAQFKAESSFGNDTQEGDSEDKL
jgi:hypothetical protein